MTRSLLSVVHNTKDQPNAEINQQLTRRNECNNYFLKTLKQNVYYPTSPPYDFYGLRSTRRQPYMGALPSSENISSTWLEYFIKYPVSCPLLGLGRQYTFRTHAGHIQQTRISTSTKERNMRGTYLPFLYMALGPCFIWVGWMHGTSPRMAHVCNRGTTRRVHMWTPWAWLSRVRMTYVTGRHGKRRACMIS